MDIDSLKSKLNDMEVSEDLYSINGDLICDRYILRKIYDKWEYFYYDEKGNREDLHLFDDEDEACSYLLKKVEFELQYPFESFPS